MLAYNIMNMSEDLYIDTISPVNEVYSSVGIMNMFGEDDGYYKRKYMKYKSKYMNLIGGKHERPSPSDSATLYIVDTKKIGNDGNKWTIVENIEGIKRWKLYKKSFTGENKEDKGKQLKNTINITSSRVVVTDPSYENAKNMCKAKRLTLCLPVKNGEYNVYIKRQLFGRMGMRNKNLVIQHKNYKGPINKKKAGSIGVDAAAAGIYDYDRFDKNWEKKVEYQMKSKYYSFSPDGITATSGIGDGGYDVYVANDESKKIVYIEIDFIHELVDY
jgi:hypothetical protein